jgi:tetratricopeptide (TPR) repeat protein/DNA-binding transcriptional ArsR family regulator
MVALRPQSLKMQTQRKFISRFSPGRTDPEDLERISVARQDLLARSVVVLRESAITENKHHLLFVGPRGSGKTHLLALIHHRLRQQADLDEGLRIAWLNEDETSTSFLDLLLRIYRALAELYPAEFPPGDIERLAGRERVEAQDLLGQSLLSRIGQRTVLVMIENLDTLFGQLDESEQRSWRAFIQNHPVFATAATAQSLFAGVSERDQPFFGFFDTTHLQPLTAGEAVELLQRIAQLNQDGALMEFLGTPPGKARVQAVHHLSGGNPRLYVVLSEFITRESLDELVRPLEGMVDEQLTPYYQERLRWLSPQQRKIVEFLCSRARPVAVKEIAAGLFAEPGSIGSQLQKLREMGYVRPNPRGRESLYELAEPLMRLSMEVKKRHSHRPLQLIVDFLRVWFDMDELERLSARCEPVGPAREYISAALEKLQPGQPDLRRELLLQELKYIDVKHCNQQQLEELRLVADGSNEPDDWIRYGLACLCHRQFLTAIEWFGKVVELRRATPEQVAWALANRGAGLGYLGRTQEAIADFTRVIELSEAPSEQAAMALFNRGISLGVLGRAEEAIADYTRFIEAPGAPLELAVQALLNRGVRRGQKGQAQAAFEDFTRVAELPHAEKEEVAEALYNRGVALGQLGRTQDALADYSRAIELPGAPAELIVQALFSRGVTLGQMGQTQSAIDDFTRVADMPNAANTQVFNALYNRGVALGEMGRSQEATADYTRAIELRGAPPELVARALVSRGHQLARLGRADVAIADYTRAIESPGASAVTLAQALARRGFELAARGRTEEALADYTRAVGLGPGPPEVVAQALLGRGVALGALGRTEEAIAEFTRASELPDTPPELVAAVLIGRGFNLGATGRIEEAMADFARVIELPGAPHALVAKGRGGIVCFRLDAGEWDSVKAQLGAFLAAKPTPASLVAAVANAVIASIFRQIAPPEAWRQRAVEAVSLYAGHESLPQLADALVRHLSDLCNSPLNSGGADQWLATWESAASEHALMQLPLRLLRTGIAYLKTQPRDEGVLLQLPIEERSLVRLALGLAQEPSE